MIIMNQILQVKNNILTPDCLVMLRMSEKEVQFSVAPTPFLKVY